MKKRLGFICGTGAALVGLGLSVYAIGQSQRGPSWELPANAATQLLLFPFFSLMLVGIALGCYFLTNRFRLQPRILRYCFWGALGLSCAVIICTYVFEPSQWPANNMRLSRAAREASTPILAACATSWLLLSIAAWNSDTRRR